MLRQFLKVNLVLRRGVSALYVTGDKAMENCAVISPHLEFENRFNDLDEIRDNLRARNSTMNLDEIKMEYEMFIDIERRKKEVEARRVEITHLLKADPENEGIRVQGRTAKEDLKKLKENSYHLEDSFVHNFLKIPNKLHSKTPRDGNRRILHTYLEPSSKSFMKNLDDYMEYFNSQSYYLKGEAAKFDLEFPLQVSDYYRDNNFIKFSTPDFVRSVISEGAGFDLNKIFLLNEHMIENKLNNLHLCGNGTILSFIPFITKLGTFSTQFPLKFVNCGKAYAQNNESSDIYETVQSTCNSVFIAASDETTLDGIIEEQLEHIKSIYEPLNLHYKVSIYSANELDLPESLRMGIEVYSPFYRKYIEVGYFSYFSDFISKRLLFNYKIGKEFHFPHIYAGNIVNTTRLLINLIECNGKL